MPRLFIAFFYLAGLAAPAHAQRIVAAHLAVDNDFFALRLGRAPMDFDYTSGLELSAEVDGAPSWAAKLVAARDETTTLRFAIGQQIYTPRSPGMRAITSQRPFAGWLYGAASVRSESTRTIRTLRVEIGVTGPPSLAEPTQMGLHDLFGSTPVTGWDDQLPFEPGVVARYSLERRIHLPAGDDYGIELRPGVALGLGTIWSGASTGAGLIARKGLLTVFGGVRGEWVWRNEFLDGAAFRSSESTPNLPLVGQFDYGASLRLGQFGATARFVTRSREYDGQPNSHLYGSLTASFYF